MPQTALSRLHGEHSLAAVNERQINSKVRESENVIQIPPGSTPMSSALFTFIYAPLVRIKQGGGFQLWDGL